MRKLTVNTLEEFHSTLLEFKFTPATRIGHWYRGHADKSWELVPTAGREGYSSLLEDGTDINLLRVWKREAIAHTQLPQYDIEIMALAQHHGLATRLLDWTTNPLVAAFFCVASEPEKDGALYALEVDTPSPMDDLNVTLDEIKEGEPGIYTYIPQSISERVINQQGNFTMHCPPYFPLNNMTKEKEPNGYDVTEITIPAHLKRDMKKMLDVYNVNEMVLFPDLDGLSRFMNRVAKEY